MTLYKNIFAKSWKITRQHPALWLLGAIVLFWGGKSIELEQLFTNAQFIVDPLSPYRPTFWTGNQWIPYFDIHANNWWIIVGSLVLILILAVISAILILGAHVGLIDAYGQFDHASGERYSLTHATTAIKKHLLPIAVIQVLVKVTSYALLAVAVVPLFLNINGALQITASLVLFLIVTFISIVLSGVGKLASVDVVIAGTPWRAALARGWVTWKQNPGVIIEFMVVVYLIFAVLTTVARAAAFLVTMPLAAGVMLEYSRSQTFAVAGIYNVVVLLIGAVFMIVASSIFAAWHMGSWVELYRELTTGHHRSVAHRMWKKEYRLK